MEIIPVVIMRIVQIALYLLVSQVVVYNVSAMEQLFVARPLTLFLVLKSLFAYQVFLPLLQELLCVKILLLLHQVVQAVALQPVKMVNLYAHVQTITLNVQAAVCLPVSLVLHAL